MVYEVTTLRKCRPSSITWALMPEPQTASMGRKTYAAIKAFQKAHHLTQDGIVGPATWAVLFAPAKSTSSSSSSSKSSSSGSSSTSSKSSSSGSSSTSSKSSSSGSSSTSSKSSSSGSSSTTSKSSSGSSSSSSSTPSSRGGSLSTPVTYAVYDFYGNQHGTYTTLSSAEQAVKSYPRGIVKDSTGKIRYTQAGYAAYSDPANLIGVYASYTEAANKAGSAGYVVNANNNVDKQPSNYYYLSGSQWTSVAYGVQGTQAPPSSDVKQGVRYFAVDVNPGNSPYNTKFYPFEQAVSGTTNWHYIGNANSSFIWENTDRQLDLRLPSAATATAIDQWLQGSQGNHSSLYGLGASFIDAQNYYGTNATYLLAHSIIESGWGESPISLNKNNIFGYGAYDSNPGDDAGIFPTDDYAIHYISWFVRNAYLTSGSSLYYQSPTLDGMNEYYATDPDWSAAIAGIMNDYSANTGQPTKSSSSILEPKSTDEPVYMANGFQGVGNMPSFVELKEYSTNTAAVETLQNALNANRNPSDSNWPYLQIDGSFG